MNLKINFILALLLIETTTFGQSYRQIVGIKSVDQIVKIKQFLTSEIDSELFPKDIQLSYFGSINFEDNKFHIYISKIEFGNHRLTTRLLIFSKSWHYLGQYSHLGVDPISIQENKLVFSSNESDGNTIEFKNKYPPKNVWIDGEIHDLY